MLPMIVAAVLAAFFHVVPMPDDILATPTFAMQGFSGGGGHAPLSDLPQFNAETAETRPYARISFVAPITGMCGVVQVQTIDGESMSALRQVDTMKKGERTYMFVPLPDAAERKEMHDPATFKLIAFCGAEDGKSAQFSSMVEYDLPSPT